MKPTNHEGKRQRVERILDKITAVTSIILVTPAAVALVAWVLVITVFVTGRALFNLDWKFVEEFTSYFLVLVSCLALLYALRIGSHIRVDVVTRLLPKRVQNILEVVTVLLAVVIVGYLVLRGWMWFQYGIENEVRSQFPSNLLQWPVYLLAPIGFAALGLGLLVQLYRTVVRLAEDGKNS